MLRYPEVRGYPVAVVGAYEVEGCGLLVLGRCPRFPVLGWWWVALAACVLAFGSRCCVLFCGTGIGWVVRSPVGVVFGAVGVNSGS